MKNPISLTNPAGIALVVLILLFLIKFFNISYPLTLTTTTKTTELAVVGEGKVDVVPDTAYVDVGINVNNAQTVDEAQKTIDKTNNSIIDAMKTLGINKADIKTSNYSIYPNYSYSDRQNEISGYNGNVTVQIRVKSPSLASSVIESATKAGANQVQGTRFVVDKPEKYREDARSAAIANAREQAEKLAKSLGIKLGRVVNIVESSPSQVYPVAYSAMAEGRGGGGGAVIEPGSQTITSVVTLYFEKK